MALPVRQQLTYWGIASAVFLVLLWALGDVILPFIMGGAIAYFLDPVADRLEKMGLSRVLATVVIFVFLLGVVILSLLVIIPLLIQQTNDLIQSAPELFNQLRAWLTERFPAVMEDGSPLRQSLVAVGETIQSRGGELLQQLLSSAAGVVNLLVLLVVVPVVAFYMLLDWDRLVATIDALLPRDHADTVRDLAGQIDRTPGEDEVRAWNVREGSTAVTTAGKIHSDLEKGFIRAEVIAAGIGRLVSWFELANEVVQATLGGWEPILAALDDPHTGGLYLFSDEGQRVFDRKGTPPVPLVPLILEHISKPQAL